MAAFPLGRHAIGQRRQSLQRSPLPPPSSPSSKPKPSVTPFDHLGASEERRGAGGGCGRARERLHGFRPAGRPHRSFASTANGALSRRLLAHFPAIDDGRAAALPPFCARRAFLLPPPATVENLPFLQLLIRSPTATSTTATVRRSSDISACSNESAISPAPVIILFSRLQYWTE